jgi:hypothetical protein
VFNRFFGCGYAALCEAALSHEELAVTVMFLLKWSSI